MPIERFARAMRLSPLDPEMFRMQTGTAMAHLFAGRFDAASSWAEKGIRGSCRASCCVSASSQRAMRLLADRTKRSERCSHLRQLDPTLRVSNLADWLPLHRPEDLATFANGLRRAGLPE